MQAVEIDANEENNGEENEISRSKKMVSVECPFKAFQVISQNADIKYIKKLGKLLTTVSEVMED